MNAEWYVVLRCPHGEHISVSLALLEGHIFDPCDEAQRERIRAKAEKPLTWRERRRFRRFLARGADPWLARNDADGHGPATGAY